MAYQSGYCNIAFADTVNISTEWIALSDDEKNLAISYGRLYIDKNYTCSDTDWDTSDYSTIPDEVQRANAMLAEQYTLNELFPTENVSGPVTREKVKAGSVESDISYMGSEAQYTKFVDQKPEITLLLSFSCSLGSANADVIRV